MAFAGPVQDFETALRGSYGNYRMALFATNSGDAAKSAKAMAGFAESWAARPQATAPPRRRSMKPTLALPQPSLPCRQIDAAKRRSTQAFLPKAHEALECASDGALHERNNIVSFSDRMNAYHAAMELLLGLDLAATDAW